MKIKDIIWYDYIVEKLIQKHNVYREEVREVLSNNPNFRFVEKGHSPEENVYAAMGRTDSGRYLIIFFVYKKDKRIIILSARDMTKSERSKMKNQKSSISQGTTYKEVSEFWDVHDLTDSWDQTKEVSFEVDLKSEITYYTLNTSVLNQVQTIAQQKGVSVEALINLWIQEKLQEQY